MHSAEILRENHTNFDWMNGILLEYSHHPLNTGESLPSIFPIPQAYVHGHYDLHGVEDRNQIYFPWYFAEACTKPDIIDTNYSRTAPGYARDEKTYNFSCLNRNPKAERCWLYVQLHRTRFFNNTITSFYPRYTWDADIDIQNLTGYMGKDLAGFFANEIMPTLPHCTQDDLELWKSSPGHFTRDIAHPGFSDAYVNIISEHNYELPFLSEKTVKPIAAGQLFLMAGPKGSIKHLEDLGFDVFRDYIDHDYYDNESFTWTRLEKMIKIAESLNQVGARDVYHATYYRRERNRSHLFSEDLRNRIYRPIRQWIRNELNPK